MQKEANVDSTFPMIKGLLVAGLAGYLAGGCLHLHVSCAATGDRIDCCTSNQSLLPVQAKKNEAGGVFKAQDEINKLRLVSEGLAPCKLAFA